MLELYRNIKRRRKELKMTQDELAKLTGYSGKSMIAKIEAGQVDISQSKIVEFAKALKTTPSDLMGWDDEDDTRVKEKLPSNILVPAAHPIPILGTICAGDGIICEQNYDGEFFIDKRVHADYCLKVKGDSMVDAGIEDGDYAFLRKTFNFVNGKIYAVVYGAANEATLKKVLKVDDHIVLQPCNDDYDPIITAPDDAHVIGKLVGVYHNI